MRGLGIATGCVTKQLLVADPAPYEPTALHVVSFGRTGEPVPLRDRTTGGPSGLMLDVRLRYRIDERERMGLHRRWQVTTTAYEYRLLDRHEEELLVFHWQPGSAGAGPDHPHLHVSASLTARVSAVEERPIALDKRHLPTGPLPLATVVRMLIEEFEVQPLRADWARLLDRAAAANRSSFASTA
jgi:hypothetical protein